MANGFEGKEKMSRKKNVCSNPHLPHTYKKSSSVPDVFNRLSAAQFASPLCSIGLPTTPTKTQTTKELCVDSSSSIKQKQRNHHEAMAFGVTGRSSGRRDGARLSLVVSSRQSRHRHERRVKQRSRRRVGQRGRRQWHGTSAEYQVEASGRH